MLLRWASESVVFRFAKLFELKKFWMQASYRSQDISDAASAAALARQQGRGRSPSPGPSRGRSPRPVSGVNSRYNFCLCLVHTSVLCADVHA